MKLLQIILISITIFVHLKSMEAPESFEKLKIKYDIKDKNSCGAVINKVTLSPHRRLEKNLAENYDLVCFLIDFKEIYIGDALDESQIPEDLRHLLKSDKNKYITIEYIETLPFTKQCLPVMDVIMYHAKDGKLDALKLIKSELEKRTLTEPKFLLNYTNAYLTGSLLKYKPEDVEFFYSLFEFFKFFDEKIKSHNNEFQQAAIERGNFVLWPEEFKELFNNFEKNIWPNSEFYKNIFLKEKSQAEEWILANQDKDEETLKKEIEDLSITLKQSCEKILREKAKQLGEKYRILASKLSDPKEMLSESQKSQIKLELNELYKVSARIRGRMALIEKAKIFREDLSKV